MQPMVASQSLRQAQPVSASARLAPQTTDTSASRFNQQQVNTPTPRIPQQQSTHSSNECNPNEYQNYDEQGPPGSTHSRGIITIASLDLKPVSALPDRVRAIFPFKFFNAMQSRCFDIAYGSVKNLVVSAPTGSGKTCVMEMAIARMLTQEDGDQAKVIYMCPTKALCTERSQDWQKKFRVLGISCNELTGDTDSTTMYEIQKSNIINNSRKMGFNDTKMERSSTVDVTCASDASKLSSPLPSLISLKLDEVHMLNEPKRGSTLEVVVSRMKTLQHEIRQLDPNAVGCIRMLAISATIPNIDDIAKWLCDQDGKDAEIKTFGEEFRPVKLNKVVLGFTSRAGGNNFQFDHHLDFKLMEIIKNHSNRKPTLVFCAMRVSVYSAADQLLQDCKNEESSSCHPFIRDTRHRNDLLALSKNAKDKRLQEYLANGATSTLSVGVNLPAHLVIIKGVYQFTSRQVSEYSELDVMQMIGRAGRPQFDDSGTAVLMVPFEKKQKYENLLFGKEIVESYLHENLIENLNAEIVLGTIRNIELCIEWGKELETTAQYRSGDKGALNAVNKKLAFPLKGKVKELSDKINVLIQSQLSSVAFADAHASSLACDFNVIYPHACRISRALVEFCRAKNDFVGAVNAIELCKSLQAKTWEKGGLHLLQVDSIGPTLATQLADAGIKTIEVFSSTPPDKLERILGRNRLFGNKVYKVMIFSLLTRYQLLDNVAALPKFSLKISEYSELNKNDVEYFVNVGLMNPKELRLPHRRAYSQVVFIAGTSENDIVDFRKFPVTRLRDQQSFRFRVKLRPSKVTLTCLLAPEDFVGLDVRKTLEIEPQRMLKSLKREKSFSRQDTTGSVDLGIYCNDSRENATTDTVAKRGLSKTGDNEGADDFDFDNLFPDSVDAQLLDELEKTVTATTVTNTATTQKTSKKPNKPSKDLAPYDGPVLKKGRVPCAHACKRKDQCEHMCCKNGVPSKTARKRKPKKAITQDSRDREESVVVPDETFNLASDDEPLKMKRKRVVLSEEEDDDDDDEFELPLKLIKAVPLRNVEKARDVTDELAQSYSVPISVEPVGSKTAVSPQKAKHTSPLFSPDIISLKSYGDQGVSWCPSPIKRKYQEEIESLTKPLTKIPRGDSRDLDEMLNFSQTVPKESPVIIDASPPPTTCSRKFQPEMESLNRLHAATTSIGRKPWKHPKSHAITLSKEREASTDSLLRGSKESPSPFGGDGWRVSGREDEEAMKSDIISLFDHLLDEPRGDPNYGRGVGEDTSVSAAKRRPYQPDRDTATPASFRQPSLSTFSIDPIKESANLVKSSSFASGEGAADLPSAAKGSVAMIFGAPAHPPAPASSPKLIDESVFKIPDPPVQSEDGGKASLLRWLSNSKMEFKAIDGVEKKEDDKSAPMIVEKVEGMEVSAESGDDNILAGRFQQAIEKVGKAGKAGPTA
ncbi:Sec63 [Dinochytrium kinnereticum]|nr:Sec63 [Dinochytrium kinnereticum]